jgi:hypothetical protein
MLELQRRLEFGTYLLAIDIPPVENFVHRTSFFKRNTKLLLGHFDGTRDLCPRAREFLGDIVYRGALA